MIDTLSILALAAQCAPQVAPTTIAAIVETESAGNPYAIGVNSGAPLTRQPTTGNEARRLAARLLAQGHDIDMGLGQINSANLSWLGLNLRQVFDPCINVGAAGRVLSHNFETTSARERDPQRALLQAISMYNTGSRTRGFRNGYVSKVQRASARITTRIARAPQSERPSTQRVASAERPSWRVF
ncbi:MAG: lytic transglycosylase domain-containing protein [Pseudomonadota bacterium]